MVISTVICRVERSGSSPCTSASDTSCHSRSACPGRICTAISEPALADFGPEPIYASRDPRGKSEALESGGKVAEERADCLRFAPFRTRGPGARVPGKDIEVRKGACFRHKAAEEEGGDDRSGEGI